MTVGELRRYLNTLPLGSDDWPVTALDSDTADMFDVHKASTGTLDGGQPALIFGVQIVEA